jgi:acyl-CoA reductase-like NAD-dependent aldehyde dehydrogenase
VTLAFNQIVCGLLAGNAIVMKPPESSPLALIASIAAFASELAPGLVNIVTGMPGEIGDALTSHPDVGKIGFTGSIRAAKQIGGNAAQTIKSVTLELGGNDAAIEGVLDYLQLQTISSYEP